MAFIVGIDGPAGSGKGTITKKLAQKFNFFYMDTGAMYRAFTKLVLDKKLNLEETTKIIELLKDVQIELKEEQDRQKVYLNGEDITKVIRSKEVSNIVSPISAIQEVRIKLVELQRKMAEGKNVILEGRDICTYVFPNADVKIYLDASQEERARRRYKENEENGIHMSYEEVLENIRKRDYIDMHKEMGALKKAEDSIVIDGTNLSIEETVNQISKIIQEKQNQ